VSQLVELGLNVVSEDPRAARGLISFLERLLTLLADRAPEAEAVETDAFRAQLELYRQRLAAISGRQDVVTLTNECLETCEHYLRTAHEYRGAREQELRELIDVLREAATVLAGEATDFSAKILSSSERIGSLAELEDLRELRQRLASEVVGLREAVAEKQRRDEQTQHRIFERVELLQTRLVKAEHEASLDPLTRLANRGSFDRALRMMVAAASDTRTPLALAMIDIDHFKKINDQHGHPVGDRVLVCTAQWLIKTVRHTDFLARYGGEEFAVILSQASMHQVEPRLRQLLEGIAKERYEYELDGQNVTLAFTASCGVAELTAGDTDLDLLRRADQALYDAKRKGRNRVVSRKRSIIGSLLSR
jgi:diguanylate cyclase